jgi:DNA-binding transcriptional LysR family regulator
VPQSRVELRFISYVIAAADHGSFRRAAAELGVQESAVSRRIRALEYQLKAILFTRSANGVQLTQAGKQFVERSKAGMAEITLAGAEAGAIGRGDNGELRIGIPSSLGSEFPAKLIRQFVMEHPTVRMTFVDGDLAKQVAAIRQFKLDVALVTGNVPWHGCTSQELWSERVFVALPENHRLIGAEALAWDDLADQHFIVSHAPPGLEWHDYLIQHLASPGHHPEIEYHDVGRFNLLSLVALGRGLTLVCEGIANAEIPGVVFRPIAHEQLAFSAVWLAENDNPVFKRFFDLGCAMAGEIDQR